MNNKELFERFSQITQNNPFDTAMELKNLRKEYRKSDFYKATRMPLHKAYKMYVETSMVRIFSEICSFLNLDTLKQKANNFLLGIDVGSIEHFFDVIKEKFNLESLQNETGELKDLIESLKFLNR